MTTTMQTIARVHCECGEITGTRCDWAGPGAEVVWVEHMPPCWRASHAAAGHAGTWPANGSVRLTLHRACAEALADDWTTIL